MIGSKHRLASVLLRYFVTLFSGIESHNRTKIDNHFQEDSVDDAEARLLIFYLTEILLS